MWLWKAVITFLQLIIISASPWYSLFTLWSYLKGLLSDDLWDEDAAVYLTPRPNYCSFAIFPQHLQKYFLCKAVFPPASVLCEAWALSATSKRNRRFRKAPKNSPSNFARETNAEYELLVRDASLRHGKFFFSVRRISARWQRVQRLGHFLMPNRDPTW